MEGWIKIHRKVLDNPIVCKDADYLAVWMYLLLNASHDNHPALFKGEKITLKPGQLITGRLSISDKLSVNESKVKRILQAFKNDQQIDQQTSNKNSLITILNWCDYQKNDQQMTSKRPANDQQVTTNKNERIKELEKEIYCASPATPEYPYKGVVDYLNQKAGTGFKDTSKDTRRHIKARFDDGYTLDDFKKVIDKKVKEWGREPEAGETDMRGFLRPSTLFGTKFEGYLNQPEVKHLNAAPKVTNKFNNFKQRDYDMGELERMILTQ